MELNFASVIDCGFKDFSARKRCYAEPRDIMQLIVAPPSSPSFEARRKATHHHL
jgi:hypothetical protein